MFSPGTKSIVSTQLCAASSTRMFSWINSSKIDVYSPVLLTRPWSSAALMRWKVVDPSSRLIWEVSILLGLEMQSRPSQLRLSTFCVSTITQKSGRLSPSESDAHLSGVVNLDWGLLFCILLDPVWVTIGSLWACFPGSTKTETGLHFAALMKSKFT